eukprot:TRINITY_DN4920_c0_g3_i1.p1 TRINITY_DN4920_c0_g3~~TRINITY_DN4920_c0_g3_i1.p1  ORF type:complete len:330 (-),score=15.44 TRINITY_DN4920_c0_g3_i1:77-1066(-)
MAAALVATNAYCRLVGSSLEKKNGLSSGTPAARRNKGSHIPEARGFCCLRTSANRRRLRTFTIFCGADGRSGSEPLASFGGEGSGSQVAQTILHDSRATAAEVSNLKQCLVDTFYGTERGLRAGSDTRGEIVELISQLEAKNPTPAPTQALSLLDGKWVLAYTTFSELFPLLAAGSLPLVKVGEISQIIDAKALSVQNSVTFTGPLATTSFMASASFEVRSPKRVQIKFEGGVLGTPQPTDAIDIPESVEVLGRRIDLAPIKSIIGPLQEAATSIAKRVSGQPPLRFSLHPQSQSWLLTTYLDEDLRISRGEVGSVFVLIKEGSDLLQL